MIDRMRQHATVGMRRLQGAHGVSAWPEPRHGQNAFMPEDQNETPMIGQYVSQGSRVLPAPAHSDHQQRDDGRNKPAEAEKANFGSYQALQHWAGIDLPRRMLFDAAGRKRTGRAHCHRNAAVMRASCTC